jgi:hypothetical protein
MSNADERVMWFRKVEHGTPAIRRLVAFKDGSACVEEGKAVEIIFEEDPDTWRDAIRYLKDRGYSECPPPGKDSEV